jgi:hypothetical protein
VNHLDYKFVLRLKYWTEEHPKASELARQVMANEFHRMRKPPRKKQLGNDAWKALVG